MIFNKIPVLPLPFPLNIFTHVLLYKRQPMIFVCSSTACWLGFYFTLLFKVPPNFISILPLLNIDSMIGIISLIFYLLLLLLIAFSQHWTICNFSELIWCLLRCLNNFLAKMVCLTLMISILLKKCGCHYHHGYCVCDFAIFVVL